MKRFSIKVPVHVNYLSDWNNFDNQLPRGKVILDKSICGCGCTEYYLVNDMPIILVSPRKELINCKMDKPNRVRPLFYFDRSGNETVQKTIQRLLDYVGTPDTGFVPKILVTYDSLKIVLDNLSYCGLLDNFSIIIDEFPCIFTDATFKGLTELTMIRRINELDNHTVFISATPIGDIYLDDMPEFCEVPIVTLIWPPSRYEVIRIVRQTMRSTREACGRVISAYKANGFFKSTLVNGIARYSTEAVFFLNNVTDIIAIIRKFKLTPDDTLVICSEDDKNRIKLRELGFDIGHAANEKVYKTENRTYTFVTKASFEGTDFYSDCSSCYIFADPSINSLSLDISIDLPQIAGRCRTRENPFRHEIIYFYKTSEDKTIEEYAEKVDRRIKETGSILAKFGGWKDPSLLRKFRNAQEREKYEEDYLDVIDSTDNEGKPIQMLVGNNLVRLADLRGIEIMKAQYESNFSVFVTLEDNGFSTSNPYNGCHGEMLNAFCSNFFANDNFIKRMKLYVEFLENHQDAKNELEAIPQIPMEYKYYYNTLSPERIKTLGYRQAAIETEIKEKQSFQNIQSALANVLAGSHKYTAYELKSIIQQVYDDLNIIKTAKGTDIEKYMPSAKNISMTDIDGKRKKGYWI